MTLTDLYDAMAMFFNRKISAAPMFQNNKYGDRSNGRKRTKPDWYTEDNLKGTVVDDGKQFFTVTQARWVPDRDIVQIEMVGNGDTRGMQFTREIMHHSESLQDLMDRTGMRKNKYNDPMAHRQQSQADRQGRTPKTTRNWRKMSVNGAHYLIDPITGEAADMESMSLEELRQISKVFGGNNKELEEMLENSKTASEFQMNVTVNFSFDQAEFQEALRKCMAEAASAWGDLGSAAAAASAAMGGMFEAYHRGGAARPGTRIIMADSAPPPKLKQYVDVPLAAEHEFAVVYYGGVGSPEEIQNFGDSMLEAMIYGEELPKQTLNYYPAESAEAAWDVVDAVIDNDEGVPVTILHNGQPLAYRRNRGRGDWVSNSPGVDIPEGL